jgi:hypothetical protein
LTGWASLILLQKDEIIQAFFIPRVFSFPEGMAYPRCFFSKRNDMEDLSLSQD